MFQNDTRINRTNANAHERENRARAIRDEGRGKEGRGLDERGHEMRLECRCSAIIR